MSFDQAFYQEFRRLVGECREAVGDQADVEDPKEFRFEMRAGDRTYAFQLDDDARLVHVGELTGDRGVAWFEDIRYEEGYEGGVWRVGERSAGEFARELLEQPPHAGEEKIFREAGLTGIVDEPETGATRTPLQRSRRRGSQPGRGGRGLFPRALAAGWLAVRGVRATLQFARSRIKPRRGA